MTHFECILRQICIYRYFLEEIEYIENIYRYFQKKLQNGYWGKWGANFFFFFFFTSQPFIIFEKNLHNEHVLSLQFFFIFIKFLKETKRPADPGYIIRKDLDSNTGFASYHLYAVKILNLNFSISKKESIVPTSCNCWQDKRKLYV